MTFEAWWKKVNSLVSARIGMSADDMPDLVMVRDLFEDGATPEEVSEELLETWVEEGDLHEELLY